MLRSHLLNLPSMASGTLLCLLASTLLCGQTTPFSEESALRGVDIPFTNGALGNGHGMAVIDLDMDRDPDLVLTGIDSVVAFYENLGNGFFVERTADVNLPLLPQAKGVAAGDPDGDGDLDLLLLCWSDTNILLRNDGGFQFTDITSSSGLFDIGNTTGAAFGDLNGDSWVDLLVVNGAQSAGATGENHLYINNGDGTFGGNLDNLILDMEEPTFQGMLQDFDLDGDLDIYLSNDRGNSTDNHNWMLENQYPMFLDRSNGGSGVSLDSMGICTGDINKDGLMDIYCTNYDLPHPLLRNDGDFQFTDIAASCGVEVGAVSWGTVLFDLGLDGDLDLLVVDTAAPDRLFEQLSPLEWVDVAPALELDAPGYTYCAVPADIDMDGDIDLVTQTHLGGIRIYIHPDEDNGNHIRLDPVAPFPNRFAVGSRLECFDASGQLLFSSQRGAGQYYKSEGEWIIHHGLADATSVAEVVVYFPTGEIRTITDLPANNTWNLYHPQLLGDADRDGDVDLNDYQVFLVLSAQTFNPSSMIVDLDGNCVLDAIDLSLMLDLFTTPLLDCNLNGIPDLLDLYEGLDTDTDGDGLLDSCDSPFIRGDVNIDLTINIADPILLLQYLFHGDYCPCIEATDINIDGQVNIADPVSLLSYLFTAAAPPPAPYPGCGDVMNSLECLDGGCP